METCSAELVILIVEFACSDDDFGQTARRIGLVSKYFRSIAEPIELRTIAVSGIDQLRAIVARLDRMRAFATSDGADREGIDVRHLFISEVTKEHALACDTYSGDSSFSRRSFWLTKEGGRAEALYDDHSDEFWSLASGLVRSASRNLRTLSLLTSDDWFASHAALSNNRIAPKALGALSELVFPDLRTLTLNHNAIAEHRCFDDNYQCPAMPALVKLHIISPIFMDRQSNDQSAPQRVHPLLVDTFSRYCELKSVVLCDDLFRKADEALSAVFGEEWQAILENGTLPGELENVVFQQGASPFLGSGVGFNNYHERTQAFVNAVRRLHVDGLGAHLPTPLFPEPGRRKYELLLAEWKDERLAFP